MSARISDQLRSYRRKRSADRTAEPFGSVDRQGGRLFVVQHHAARNVHYDLRLEFDGVLRSWAVPKGPSPNPADRRLAIRVEDHPLEYAGFEGHIPEGNYGAGAVIVWDRGVWVPIGDPTEGLEEGKLLFELKGYKLRGKWTLIKIKRAPKAWLLVKEKDGYACEAGTECFPADSILSGVTVDALKENRDAVTPVLEKLQQLGAPKRTVTARQAKVMLAQAGEPFSKSGWLFEVKYDGYRLLVGREADTITLYSRAGNDLTAIFPEVVDVVRALPFDRLVMDGEVVVHDARGIPSFSRLQKRGRLTRSADIQRAAVELPASLYVFDLLGFGGYDLRSLPLEVRKSLLKGLLPSVGPVRYSEHVEEQGKAMYEYVREMGLEGIVAKKADSSYRAGRSSQWIKIGVEKTDDFIVAGYTEPKGSQPQFGALLLAQYVDDELVYAGRVGSGFTSKALSEIGAELKRATQASPPLGAPVENTMHWVEPRLICEVKFKQTTADGLLREPVFLRCRDDKRMEECMRKGQDLGLPEAPKMLASDRAGRSVRLTNLDKVFWPEEGYTKGDLIDYYRAISGWLLPYLRDRPVVLTRYPDGIAGKSFFQKDAPEFVPDWVRIERVWSESAQREVSYFVVEDEDSLVYLINMGTVPLHIWSSRIGSLERPDWCILDLDPKDAPFKHVVMIAKAIRSLCHQIDLPCFVKTSGATGLHVLLPLGHQYTYEQSRSLGELLARVIVTELPDIATIERSVAAREGRVYLDYLQNGHGRLLVSAFSVRPLPGASVSMPLEWDEVTKRLDVRRFTIKNAARRLRLLKRDPMRKVLQVKPELGAALARLAKRFE